MTKRISAVAIQGLKEALTRAYWYKSDLRSFLQNSMSAKSVISLPDWQNGLKRQIVSDIVDTLAADQDQHLGDLRRICYELVNMRNFRHLEQLDGGETKAQMAKQAIEDLRKLVETNQEATKEAEEIESRRKQQSERLRNSGAVLQKLQEICTRYMALVTGAALTPQQRGFELERVLFEVFELFDLDPKASFKLVGEQIDGAFCLDGTDYLFEGKWQRDAVSSGDLDKFAAKIQRKLDNTLGLCLSICGFSEDGIRAHSAGKKFIILMTGEDLMAVLEGRIDFITLLTRKKRHAAQTGNILLRIHEVFQTD